MEVGEAQGSGRFLGFRCTAWCGVVDADDPPSAASEVADEVKGDVFSGVFGLPAGVGPRVWGRHQLDAPDFVVHEPGSCA